MALIDTSDLKSGFWLGLGLMLAFTVLGFIQYFLRKSVHRGPANG